MSRYGEMRSVNPANGETLATFAAADDADVDRALDAAVAAFRDWRARPIAWRCERLATVADLLERDLARHAELIVAEMGKPIREAKAEVEKCARGLRWYAENAAALLADERKQTEAQDARVTLEPLGVILAVMPWNYPYWQVIRFAAPNLAAGNVGLLKHASNVPRCALALEETFQVAGCPSGAFSALLVGPDRVAGIVADRRVAAATLTGSEKAGKSLGEAAGKALKKCVLELGGSDPFIVLDDADLEAAARVGCKARFQNAGQSCIAAKRFIVADRVHDEFQGLFVEAVRGLSVGDPTSPSTDLGPVAKAEIAETLERQIEDSGRGDVAMLIGGARITDRGGSWFEPSVAAGVTPGMPLFDEEVFGPVAALVRARDEDHAIELANATRFGLGATIFTRDLARARRLVPRIEAGQVFVNAMVASDPRLPFGGIKSSGHGRELERRGMHEFLNVKTVSIEA